MRHPRGTADAARAVDGRFGHNRVPQQGVARPSATDDANAQARNCVSTWPAFSAIVVSTPDSRFRTGDEGGGKDKRAMQLFDEGAYRT